MAEGKEKMKNPWAALTAGIAFAALAGFHYLTFSALEAQSESLQQVIDSSTRASTMEITGLRTRQQLILAEVRELRAELATDEAADGGEATEGEEAAAEESAEEATE